ncbi:MAG: hypothetical protein KDA24_11070 [Deltaproteobacteria bacterium]|nr:hypothetical protein [Deltaproteobacteria bacterium]
MPPGFLGTNADLLMDIVLVSFAVILPLLVISWRQARAKDYAGHKRTQVGLGIGLAIVVAIFEADLSLSGGIFVLTEASAYAGTTVLKSWIYGHTVVAILTSLVWAVLIILSLVKFESPPAPNAFSGVHMLLGRTGMILMMATGLSAFPLYYYGFYS